MSILEALSSGPRTSKEIQAVLGLSQASVSRLVRNEPNIVRLPGPKPYSYAATRPAFGTAGSLPIANIDVHGKHVPKAMLRPLQPRTYLAVLLTGSSQLLAGENRLGHFDGLPYYMDDARPQGFLGRLVAETLSQQSDEFSPEPDDWSEEQVGRYLVANGDNLPGDFIFGSPMMNRVRSRPAIQSRQNYSALADATMQGLEGVSSAGGEQPKFTAFISDIESHVIVKFTPAYDDLASRRWRDILVTEFHALTVLAECGFTAAETRLSEQSDRYFLESKRFDRVGWAGRSSMFSLRTIDAEFVGSGGSWVDVFTVLLSADLASLSDLNKVKGFQLFGELINNTDMHLGNLSVAMDGDRFSLLPVYDMCSMGFAPKGNEVTKLDFELPDLQSYPQTKETKQVIKAAAMFWERVQNDEMTSDELQTYIRQNKFVQTLKNFT